MGSKRPFDEEAFLVFPLKHPRQVDCEIKFPPGESEDDLKFQSSDQHVYENGNVILPLTDKGFEISAPLSCFPISATDENARCGAAVSSSVPEYFEFSHPRRSEIQFEYTYSSGLNGYPRKQIPVGPNHQAEIPVWKQMEEKHSPSSDCIVEPFGEKFIGDCLYPMPDPELSAHSDLRAGDGRKDCLCTDQGSVRCTKQHVKEARDRIRETLGHEKFVQLGFFDMGEEVSQRWTEEEGRAFREVVYSNPVSHHMNFWECLSLVFPSRSKGEIVNYYYNVFMLRRRAVQNRSNFLDINSDDDEWQGINTGPIEVMEAHKDYVIWPLLNQAVQVDHEDDSTDDDNDGYGDDDDDDDDDDYDDGDASDNYGCDRDCDVGNEGNTTGSNGGRSLVSKAKLGWSLEDGYSKLVSSHVGKISGNDGGTVTAPIVLSTSVCQADRVDSIGSADTSAAGQENALNNGCNEYAHGNNDEFIDNLGTDYLNELCDAKIWDAKCPKGQVEGLDLLSTGNVIEEIFGPCTLNSKLSDVKSLS